jgi:hypothetical protein
MVLLKRAGTISSQFYDYLQGSVARRMLEQHGFTVPR